MVVLYNWIEKEDKDTGEKSSFPIIKYYRIFRQRDIEGIEIKEPEKTDNQTIKQAEEYIRNTGARIDNNSNGGVYKPLEDKISIPDIKTAKNEKAYYNTIFHELVHWTGHKTRLNRLDKNAAFGSESYSKEELTAEIGASIVADKFGIKEIENAAAYVKSWLRVLKNNTNWIFTQAGKAEKAVEYLDGLQPE